jgi:hypothetical protein
MARTALEITALVWVVASSLITGAFMGVILVLACMSAYRRLLRRGRRK